jgi:hypothetical protein
MTRFLIYLLRWQLSTIILAPCIAFFNDSIGSVGSAVIANLIGGCIFFFIDRKIFQHQ